MAESSFDVVSSVDLQEVKNAIAQAMKEITTRFDLKGTGSDISLQGEEIVITSADEFKMKAVRDVLETRLVKRNVPLKALTWGTMDKALGGTVRQKVAMQKGIPTDKAREIVKIVKGSKLKVQAAIQGDQVRVSGKNRDDLQAVIQSLKAVDLGRYIREGGGKRIRPALLLLACRACGFRGERAIVLASVVEFIHTATLLHDDIIDQATVRRGRRSVNSRWGNDI